MMAYKSLPGGAREFIRFKHENRRRYRFLVALILLLFISTGIDLPAQSRETPDGTVRTEIPHGNGKIVLSSDSQERIASRYRASGHVTIVFTQPGRPDKMLSGEEAEYDKETGEGFINGTASFSQDKQSLTCSRMEFNFSDDTAIFYDAKGYTDQEFFITSQTIRKTGADLYRVEKMDITACKQKRPHWGFSASLANIRVDPDTGETQTVRLHNAIFKIKGIPVLYFPFLIVPMEKKERSGGLIPFHTGSSNIKGRSFTEGYYQPLGRSADILAYTDYYSKRGFAFGGVFRIRPNPETRFSLEAYGINDRMGQGGVQLMVDGESRFKQDWRAVARANITSNFVFRQAFSDSFRYATIPQELATVFLTGNHNSISANITYERDEVHFPIHSLVIRKTPSLDIASLGTPLGNSPLILSYRVSMDGLSRRDSIMETPGLTQRLDFFPRLTLRLPSFKGFSLMPSIGVRETYYSSQMSADAPSGIVNQAFNRHYTDVNIEMRMPALERDFSSSPLGSFTHAIEPFVAYRWIHGINNLYRTIRFDEQDAIADTNELEYGIVNRFYRNGKAGTGRLGKQEILSFGLVQKYYFDPTFGGAFRADQMNAFYPMDSITGFYQTAIPRNFSPISAIFQAFPQSKFQADLKADFDTRLMRWRNGSITTEWQLGQFSLSGTYFGIRGLETGMLANNNIQGQIAWGRRDRGFASRISVAYNLQANQLLNSNTQLSYKWDCCALGADYNQFDLGIRKESRFSFSFMLKGLGSFGSMKRSDIYF
jgi:LPS-assembly protein